MDGVPYCALEKIASAQENRVGVLSADVSGLVDETGVPAKAFAVGRILGRASAAELVGLFETAVNVVDVQDSQVERVGR